MSLVTDGDILACFGADPVSVGISCVTAWPFGPRELCYPPSHVAMITRYDGETILVESTQLCRHACLVLGRPTAGVQAHYPEERIQDYVNAGGWVDVYRPTAINRYSMTEQSRIKDLLVNYFLREHNPYDTLGAALSGTRLLQRLGMLFPKADMHSLFCSELIAAVLQCLHRMNRTNPARMNPGRLLRELVWSGVYERVHRYASPHSWHRWTNGPEQLVTIV